MTFAAIAVITILVLLVILASIRKKKLVMPKPVFLLLAAAIGFLIIQNTFNKDSDTVKVEYYQEKAPSVQLAPFMTYGLPTRNFYVATYKTEKGTIWLTAYYDYDKGKWKFRDIPYPVNKAQNPKFEIVKRDIGG